ncbi:MAG: undecaprenyldiphospho-muramoylpentapeptide beta-N-acetylglucosaminyltransferase [Wenzhouxiangellaceae bacterium]|nr:undecaprenyldiphospho-muramoylpentapeptide beta-N-acetylglucosaminyltransferase [Wenzhouxiangellaceae bacterium]
MTRRSVPRRVTILAGGTGGHIFPGLAVARRLVADGVDVRWLGTPHGLENRLVPTAGLPLDRVGIRGLRGRGLTGWLAAPFRILRAIVQSWRLLREHRPGCALSMGGYAAGPAGVAARLLGVRLVIHEQNAVAGWTNRLLRPLAGIVCTGFPDVFEGARVTGNPVREEISALPPPERRYAGREGPLRVLVIGGSQGAAVFNEIVPDALSRLDPADRPAVRHQGGRQWEDARQRYADLGVEAEVSAFIDDMADAWGWADVAICRAGALTVAELAAAGVPAVLVPFPGAVDDHQTENARFLADRGGAWCVRQDEFDAERLARRLEDLDRETLSAMARRARARAMPDAADRVAAACREVLA